MQKRTHGKDMARILEHIAALDAADFIDLDEASTSDVLAGQASTADFLASLGVPSHVLADDHAQAARNAFASVTNPAESEAEKKKALLALRVPSAVRHLAGMLSQYDWQYIEQASEIRGYVVAGILKETTSPDAKIRLKSLELLGKLTGVDSFTTRVEITHKDETVDELERRVRERLAKYAAARTVDAETVVSREVLEVRQGTDPDKNAA